MPGSVHETLRALREHMRRHPIQGFELEMLGRLLRDLPAGSETSLPIIRVAILSNFTSEPVASAVHVALLSEGFRAVVYEAPFGAYRQEIVSPGSALYEFKPDMILLAVSTNDVTEVPSVSATPAEVERALSQEVERWRPLWAELSKRSNAVILQQTLEVPEATFLGMAEQRACWSPRRFIAALKERLIEAAPADVKWVDVDSLAAYVGRANWNDPRLAHHGRFGFSGRFLPDYARLLGSVMRGTLGRSRKALIVDLDNTLWGGVIGDDGPSGIRLGPGTAEGEAYEAFCRYLGNLARRGVILGICSKNDMANVAEVFEHHRHMPLTLDMFSVVRCNWEDKATNLSAIAEELNIDPSAIVFVDDNPAECELIRQRLPSAQIVQLDGDPASFIRRLEREYLFESQNYSTEDVNRTASYRARKQSTQLQAHAADLDTYLESLEMRGEVWSAKSADIGRLAQMEAKTNQFNLTTRRWTASHLTGFMQAEDHDALCFQLVDRFADHGLVGSMVVHYKNEEARILSWLLSCRVFSRTCEEFMLIDLIQRAKRRGIRQIIGEYVSTPKNKVVENLFARLGFEPRGATGKYGLTLSSRGLPRSLIRNATQAAPAATEE
jgi:FkbH-like protein